jgi:hypothetical protein
VSDPFTIGSTAYGASFVGGGDEKCTEANQVFAADSTTITSDNSAPANSSGGQHDLRQSLDWLLRAGTANEHEHDLSHEELQEKQRRRLDLLLWILHLEPRLTPYGEPA